MHLFSLTSCSLLQNLLSLYVHVMQTRGSKQGAHFNLEIPRVKVCVCKRTCGVRSASPMRGVDKQQRYGRH